MRNLIFALLFFPFHIFSNDLPISSKIKEVTVYLNGASITRSAECNLPSGASEIILSGLSTKIHESSIQISGLQSVSILSISYDINYLAKADRTTEFILLENDIHAMESKIALLRNRFSGLEEEELVIHTNRTVSNRLQSFDLEKIKQVSTYYRERITAIKDEIFKTNEEINAINVEIRQIKKQMAEINNTPTKEQGEIKLKLDAPIASQLNLILTYQVDDAGWIPNYDIKSKAINTPLNLAYKAHVYQKTGSDWNDVKVTLSTGNPSINVVKPNLGAKYLNFIYGHKSNSPGAIKKQRYVYNPMVKKITGTVLDESGIPLPGANILVKSTSNSTQSDFDGFFTLEVQDGQELVVSYIGAKTEELPIYSSIMNIRLSEDAQALEEGVVSGYGVQKKNDITGAATSVGLNQLSGRAAGVQINHTSGVKIRGASTLNRSSNPLYVVDGLIISANDIANIDQEMIASIEVVKGESANSIYGSRGANGVVIMTTKKSDVQDAVTNIKFVINKPYSIVSDGDITSIEINTFKLDAQYEYFAAPIVNENVFLTTTFKDWEQYNLLPGEASIYFKGAYAGKTAIDPYTTKEEMILSLGIDPNITVTRKQIKDFKSKTFIGINRVVDRTYDLEVKNNKAIAIDLKLMDRIPISQNKEIKVDDVETNSADYTAKNGLLSWKLNLKPGQSKKETFSFQLRYPKFKNISL